MHNRVIYDCKLDFGLSDETGNHPQSNYNGLNQDFHYLLKLMSIEYPHRVIKIKQKPKSIHVQVLTDNRVFFPPPKLLKLKCDCCLNCPFYSHWFIIHAMRYVITILSISPPFNHPPTTPPTLAYAHTHARWRSVLKDMFAVLIPKTEE